MLAEGARSKSLENYLIKSRGSEISTLAPNNAGLISWIGIADAARKPEARTSKKRKMRAKILPWFIVTNKQIPGGLTMISGSIKPIARTDRSPLLKGRAINRAKPRPAKRSIRL
ncbi:MAG TPA: hypothetical protein VMY43_03470 [Methanothrix sp.]|nr:hypothetical protein [Methanothrix sp.]